MWKLFFYRRFNWNDNWTFYIINTINSNMKKSSEFQIEKKILDELKEKGFEAAENLNSIENEYDEPLSKSRKLRILMKEIRKEFPNND